MIRVTVELISANGRDRDRVLGVADICNIGGTETRGNYGVQIFKGWTKKLGKRQTLWKELEIKDFPRKKLGGWDLLYRILKQAVGERNEG